MFLLDVDTCYLVSNICNALNSLERETAVFFDLNYFETLVLSGKWEEVERYLSGYGSLKDDKFLFEVYFEVRKHKLFEALDM